MNPNFVKALTAAFARLSWLLLAYCLGFAPPAWSANSPEVERGLAWLTAQVQADGSLADEAGSVAFPHQSRAEAADTLTKLSVAPAALVAAVLADEEPTSESMARQARVAGRSQTGAIDTLSALVALQNADGGFGGAEGHQSNALDTALALLALSAQRGFAYPMDSVQRALDYLVQSRIAGDGWGVHGQSSAYVTALALWAGQEWHAAFLVGNITLPARDWLLAARTNGAYGTTLDNAVALMALTTQTTDAAILEPLASALRTGQAVDGSWSGDPFLTALALRALWTLDNAPPPATTGGLTGSVVDAASSAQLDGVAARLVELPDLAAQTDSTGVFTLSGIEPGSYTLTLSKVGYESLSAAVQISAGQITSVGTVKLRPATLTATLVGTVKNQYATALSGVIVTVGTASTLTDAKGQYVLTGIAPGAAAIAVTLAGYTQAVSAPLAFEAGKVYSFSPTLYTGTPAATVLRGKIVDAGTALPIPGATVSNGTQTIVTAADGGFSFTGVSVGAFSLSVAASGYSGISVTGALVAGVNDIGNLPLAKLAGTATLSGRVTDAQTGAAISGATVSAAGVTSVSAADGSYTLAGIASTSFDLTASAAGYFGATQHVSVTQAGSITVDVPLTKVQASGIGIDSVTLSKANYLPTEVMDAEVVIRNTTDQSADVIVDALVTDGQGSVVMELKANAHGLGDNPPNLPLTVPATNTTAVTLSQLLLRQSPGSFVVWVRAYDAGGRTIAEAQASFAIDALAVLGGGVVVDPPLTQAGGGTPVHFTGQLANLGNEPIPAGDLKLTVTVENPDTQSVAVAQASVRTVASGAPLTGMRGMATDAAGNIYTASAISNDGRIFRIAPDGTTTVVAQVPLNYPNYPSLTDVALDGAGNFLATNASGGTVWKLDGQGGVTRIVLTTLSRLSGIDIDTEGNWLLTGQSETGEHRLVKRDIAGAETVLWANGLSSPMAMTWDDSNNLVVTNNGDNTLTKVTPTGEIQRFVSGLNRPMGITRDGAGNFYVANNGNDTIVKVTATGETSVFASGLSQPFDLKFDGNGNLFVSCQGDHAIRKVAQDGAISVFARGVASNPAVMRYDAAGNLLIANEDGTLRRLDTSGVASEVATGLSTPRGMAIDSVGALLVTNYSTGTVAKVDAQGKTTLISGLVAPWGLAIGDGGDVLVAEYGGMGALSRFESNGTAIERIESLLYSPSLLAVDGAGNIVVRNNGSLALIGAAGSRVFMKNFYATALTPDPAGGAVFATAGTALYRVAYDGSAVKLKALPFYPYGIAVDGTGNVLIGDQSGRRIYRLDTVGNLTVLAQLGAYPTAMVSDGTGAMYMLASDRVLYSVAQDGTISALSSFYVSPNWDLPYGLGIGADGRPLVWTNTSRVIAVDPVSGSQTILKSGVRVTGAVIDGSGRLYVTDSSSHDLVTYGAAGSEIARLSGFVNPRDAVWDGTQYWFVDSERIYTLSAARGSYPVKRGNASISGLAVGSNGRVMGVSGTTLYRWDQTSYSVVSTIPGAVDLRAVAVRADGATSVADYSRSRVVTLDATYSIIADYAGLMRPAGLAFDSTGRLLVASTASSAIARFGPDAPANSVPMLFSRVSSPSWLDFDAGGQLWVSNSSTLRIDAKGTATQVSTTPVVAGIVASGASLFAVNTGGNQLLRWNGTSWGPFAAGLATPQGVRALPDGGVVVANSGNGSVVLWRNSTLDTVAGGLLYPHDLDLSADGQSLYVAGEQGRAHKIGFDGSVADLAIGSLVDNASLYGVHTMSTDKVALVPIYVPSVYELTVTESVAAPVAGTVVHEAVASVAEIQVGEGIADIDFGSWVPPFGGDFKASVARAGLTGEVSGYLHAGPFAQGVLATQTSSVPPGTQIIPLQLKVTGADFSSVSRVETALVKPTVYGVRPSGMTADRAGNIYVTDGANLRKTTPAGQSSILASGYSFRPGMAIDSNEHLYIPAYSGGVEKLLRFSLDGQATVLAANLGGTPSGVAVNSHDEIFVGMPGRLLKVGQDGTTSVVSTTGIPSPVGVSIDGRDNIYVLNSGHLVTQIKPDGGATTIYNKGDGVEHPYFEYEGMAMAADCGENLYLAPVQWNRVAQNGEEHTLVQVVARTGQVAVVLDGYKVHYDLGDMDYIVFDRLGSRILIWTDYSGGRIWQVPVTCGAISVEAHLVAKPGQTFTGANRPAAAVVPLADGRTEYVWSLRDVPASGVTFGFDTVLEALSLGETRPVMDSGFLLFKNTFSPTDIKVPLDVPVVQVSNLVNLGVAADQPSYGANATAIVMTHLDNANVSPVAGTLEVDVYDAAGVQVGNVTRQGVLLPASGGLDVPGQFAIGAILPGVYTVKATLKDDLLVLSQATTVFTVTADNAEASATSRLAMDKAAYEPIDRVTISSRVISESANLILENLTLALTMSDPSGAVVFTKAMPVAQLAAGATVAFVNQHGLAGAIPGVYTVMQILRNSTGQVLDTRQATFEVLSSAQTGAGLTGTLEATPARVQVGAPVAIAYTATNGGNAALAGLPLTVTIIDPAAQRILAEFSQTADLTINGSHAGNATWTAAGQDGVTLVAVLTATVAGKPLTLAQDSFVLVKPPIELDVSQAVSGHARILALASCEDDARGDDSHGDDGHGHDKTTRSGHDDGHDDPHHGYGRERDDSHGGEDDHCHNDDDHDPDYACDRSRADAMAALLNGLDVGYHIVTRTEDFETAFRSGRYNVYWLSGKQDKLDNDLAAEVREAIYRGDGLLVDGTHDERNHVLDEAAGVNYRGKQGEEGLTAQIDGPWFTPMSLATTGRASTLRLDGGSQQGSLVTRKGPVPGIVSHGYGAGRSLSFAFDLVESYSQEPAWAGVLGEGLSHIVPAVPDPLTGGAYLPILTRLRNLGIATEVRVTTQLPLDASPVDGDPDGTTAETPTGTTVTWQFPLAEEGVQDLLLGLTVPLDTGDYHLTTLIETLDGDVATPYEEPVDLAFSVRAQSERLSDAVARIQAIGATSHRDRQRRDQALDALQHAQRELAKGDYADAIDALLEAVDRLRDIQSADAPQARQAVDWLLKETEARWYRAEQ